MVTYSWGYDIVLMGTCRHMCMCAGEVGSGLSPTMVMVILKKIMNSHVLPHGISNGWWSYMQQMSVSGVRRLKWCDNDLFLPYGAEGEQQHLRRYELTGLQYCTHP